jgi:hypothetical protein
MAALIAITLSFSRIKRWIVSPKTWLYEECPLLSMATCGEIPWYLTALSSAAVNPFPLVVKTWMMTGRVS